MGLPTEQEDPQGTVQLPGQLQTPCRAPSHRSCVTDPATTLLWKGTAKAASGILDKLRIPLVVPAQPLAQKSIHNDRKYSFRTGPARQVRLLWGVLCVFDATEEAPATSPGLAQTC